MERHIPDWVPDAVFYQVFPDRFRKDDEIWPVDPTESGLRAPCGGNLEGIRKAIAHFELLGVNALYLTPIFHAAHYHKYDTIDYFAIDPAFGDKELFRCLVTTLHQAGIRIVLDGVFNHCSDRHPFFLDAIEKGRASAYWDWFTIDGERVCPGCEPNYDCWAGVGHMPEWNLRNPVVRTYMLDVVRYWTREFGIDGWRLDTTEYLPPDFVREIYTAARETSDETYILGEVMGLGTPWFRHDAVDGVMHYRLLEFLSLFIAESRWCADAFAHNLMKTWHSYPDDGNLASYTLLSSHDSPRFLTLCGGDARRFLLALVLQMTLPGAPAIYYGDEIGLQGHDDPDNRRCFPWEEEVWNQEILSVVRRLISLRNDSPTLRRGGLRLVEARNRLVVLERTLGDDLWRIIVNASADVSEHVSLPEGRWKDVLSEDEDREELVIPAVSYRILRRFAD